MSGSNGAAQRASWCLPYFFNVISAAGWTGRNFPGAGELDEICQVIWEPDGVTIGQAIFQGKRIGGGINLAEIVNAGVGGAGAMLVYSIRYRNHNDDYDYKQ